MALRRSARLLEKKLDALEAGEADTPRGWADESVDGTRAWLDGLTDSPDLIPLEAFQDVLDALEGLPDDLRWARWRNLCRINLFYLLRHVLRREDMAHPWLHERVNEVQQAPDGYLDLWARDHRKSSIITFGLTIKDILATHGEGGTGEEVTVGIFSHTRPIAKSFLRQIKGEFERNDLLRGLFPDVIWENPKRDAVWSEDSGIVLKRKSNPKESTVEAWGLVDGQPTSKHFRVLVFDDVVTQASVTTPDMQKKTLEAWELAQHLGTEGGIRRHIGTRYHYSDAYGEMLRRDAVLPRIYPATADGTVDGEPVLLSPKALAKKRKEAGPYTFASQMLLDPMADETQGFKREWLQHYKVVKPHEMNKYILVDPASGKRKSNDYTSLWVIGLGPDENYYVLDMVRDRLSLTERARMVMEKHQRWAPVVMTGYERYGMQADIEHIKHVQDQFNYRFPVQELAGPLGNLDRVRRLIPIFEQKRLYLPETLHYTTYEKQVVDLVQVFIEEEYAAFPVGMHADMLDSLSRILDDDLGARFPRTDRQGRSGVHQASLKFDVFAV